MFPKLDFFVLYGTVQERVLILKDDSCFCDSRCSSWLSLGTVNYF